MNVSPEILRMLGASEEAIAAKEKEISHINWVAPTKTGLEHSKAIADFDQVALGATGAGEDGTDQKQVKRVFVGAGAYDNPSHECPPTATSTSASGAPVDGSVTGDHPRKVVAASPGMLPVFKVKIADAPQGVPKKWEFKLPPKEEQDDDADDSGSDTSWDEVSVIDGHSWWETGSDEVRSAWSLAAMYVLCVWRLAFNDVYELETIPSARSTMHACLWGEISQTSRPLCRISEPGKSQNDYSHLRTSECPLFSRRPVYF